ncbi:hypothetical protein D3C87_1505200 [compost metagenome]
MATRQVDDVHLQARLGARDLARDGALILFATIFAIHEHHDDGVALHAVDHGGRGAEAGGHGRAAFGGQGVQGGHERRPLGCGEYALLDRGLAARVGDQAGVDVLGQVVEHLFHRAHGDLVAGRIREEPLGPVEVRAAQSLALAVRHAEEPEFVFTLGGDIERHGARGVQHHDEVRRFVG